MRRKRNIASRLERAMDLPGGAMADISLVELEGDRRAVVTGCRGIMRYTEECVGLRVPEGCLLFYGEGLELGCLSADGATVTGKLRRIEWGE